MSSWFLLLFAALAACLRPGRAQGESLPSSLVDTVMDTPISTMEELQRLLDIESEDVEEDEDEVGATSTRRRLPRSLVGIQVAQVAMCKVRTEVLEVTRAMLDRRNANFMLWPLCVEVQRCSGCCNARTMQCVPVVTETRHLQMTKIQYNNGRPVYEKVVIPVEDHVTCSCQSQGSVHIARDKAPPPPAVPHLPAKPATPSNRQSKEELHRHDDLKHNQRLQLEEQKIPETRQWQQPKYTLAASTHTLTHIHTQGVSAQTLTHTPLYASRDEVSTRHTTFAVPQMLSDATQTFGTRDAGEGVAGETPLTAEKVPDRSTAVLSGSGDGGVKVTTSGGGTTLGTEHRRHRHHHHRHHDDDRHPEKLETTLQHSGQLEVPVHRYAHIEVIGQSGGQTELLANRGDSQSAEGNGQSDCAECQTEEGLESGSQKRQLQQQQHHHHHQRQHLHSTQSSTTLQSSTQRAVTDAPPAAPPTPQSLPPRAPQRRRRRKHRRRISKSAMRAMIMVMS